MLLIPWLKILTGKGAIFDPKCKYAIYNIKNCTYKPGTTEPDEPSLTDIKANPDKKFLFHMLDAVTYPAEYYFPVK